MAQVTVTIDGKAYRMACDEGQEPHLEKLAERFDGYVGHLKGAFGEIGDQRLLVMAAIMVMDELDDAERRAETREQERDATRIKLADVERRLAEGGAGIEQALNAMADRIEALTRRLNAS